VTEDRARPDANHCFVCGPTNPFGLKIAFRMEDAVCRASFTPGQNYAGYDQMTHGGILYSALDDVMANWHFLQGARAHTAKCEIRYRQPVMIGTELLLEGRLLKRKGPVAIMSGVATRSADGVIVADTQGSFMVVK
jgi:acyl-coenzyme A thioesterase PaaI-like protein